MELNLSYELNKNIAKGFKCPTYPNHNWVKVINTLKKKRKDEVVEIIDKVLRKSYNEVRKANSFRGWMDSSYIPTSCV